DAARAPPCLCLRPLRASADPRDLPSFPTRRSSDLRTGPRRELRGAGLDFLLDTVPAADLVERQNRQRQQCRHDYEKLQHLVVDRSEEHTSELQSRFDLVCRLLLEKKNRPQIVRKIY